MTSRNHVLDLLNSVLSVLNVLHLAIYPSNVVPVDNAKLSLARWLLIYPEVECSPSGFDPLVGGTGFIGTPTEGGDRFKGDSKTTHPGTIIRLHNNVSVEV